MKIKPVDNDNDAFTLVELLVVIFIIAIISASGIISLARTSAYRLDSAVVKIISDLSWCRTLAVNTHYNYTVVFNLSADNYIIYRDNMIPANEIARRNTDIDLLSVIPAPDTVSFFYPAGRSETKNIQLGYQGKTEQISVFGDTGYARKQ